MSASQIVQMSDTPGPSRGGGKATRERRRPSIEQPYKKTKLSPDPDMPTTRHSPSREYVNRDLGASAPASPLPLGEIMKELSLLRQSMENKFVEAGKKSDSLRAEVVGKLEANDQAVSELQQAVTDVTLSVDQNQRAIHEVRAEVERREVELPDKVRAIVNEALDRPRSSGRNDNTPGLRHRPLRRTSSHDTLPDKKAEAYALARRSLRLWPVPRDGDLLQNTRNFLVNEMRLDQQHAAGLSIEVRRAGGPSSGRGRDDQRIKNSVRDEVLVRFDSVRDRDDVRSFAKNLERKGRGLRLEVPDHLWANFRALQELGYELKQKNDKLRRNILFDDSNSDLKMDITSDSVVWKTVLPDEARKSLQRCRPSRTRRVSLSREELDSMLGGRVGNEPEAMEDDDTEEY